MSGEVYVRKGQTVGVMRYGRIWARLSFHPGNHPLPSRVRCALGSPVQPDLYWVKHLFALVVGGRGQQMSVQMTYTNATPKGIAGGLYDLSAHTVDSRRYNDAEPLRFLAIRFTPSFRPRQGRHVSDCKAPPVRPRCLCRQ